MTAPRFATLARRQQVLLVRSSELRAQLARDAMVWQRALALAGRVHVGWRWLRAHPEGLLAAFGVLLVLHPRRALRWGPRLWAGWRLWQRLQRRLQPCEPGLH